MKNLMVLFSFLFLVNPLSGLAQIDGRRFFLEFSGGKSTTQGPYELKEFYKPSFTLSLNSGYMLTPHIGIIPVSLFYRGYRFKRDNYTDYYFELRNRIFADNPGVDIDFWPYGGTESTLSQVAFTPGIIFTVNILPKVNLNCQLGAGIYRNIASMEITTLYSWVPAMGSPKNGLMIKDGKKYARDVDLSKALSNDLGLLLRGGMEFFITDRTTFTMKIGYNKIYTKYHGAKRKKENGMRFFYLTEGSLKFENGVKTDSYYYFFENENTRTFEFTGGLKFYFGN